MIIKHLTYNFSSNSGHSLYGQSWEPLEPAKAVIWMIHGLGEHSGRYEEWAKMFCQHDIAFFAIDHFGHGQSAGKRGTIKRISTFLDDFEAFVNAHKSRFVAIPNLIYGHSMGGNLALNYILTRHHSFKGAIITAPWLQLTNQISTIRQIASRLLSNISPNLTISNQIKSEQLATSSSEIKAHDKDPLCHSQISIRLYNELNSSANHIMAKADQFHLPILLMHGQEDEITSHDASQQFALRAAHCHFFSYPHARHELHREAISDDMATNITNWILKFNDTSNDLLQNRNIC